MNYQRAEAAVGAAIAESLKIGVKMQIAVLDEGGHLVAFARMDGAWLGSADIALKVRFYLLKENHFFFHHFFLLTKTKNLTYAW